MFNLLLMHFSFLSSSNPLLSPKVEIALRVVQFWSEIKLVITNCTPASRLISDQIALHSVQLPLLIYFNRKWWGGGGKY